MGERCPYCGSIITRTKFELVKRRIAHDLEAKVKQQLTSKTRLLEADFRRKRQKIAAEHKNLNREKRELRAQFGQRLRDAVGIERRKILNGLRRREIAVVARERNFKIEVKRAVQREVATRTSRLTSELRSTKLSVSKVRRDSLTEGAKSEKLRNMRKIVQLEQRVSGLQRELQNKSADELGEEGERDLSQILRRDFPNDNITRISKGERGADIRQVVKWQDRPCGNIIYESKNVKSWSNTFLTKAMRYKSQYNTPNVIIVSTAFPPKERWFCVRNNVPIIHPSKVAFLVPIIRDSILTLAKSKLPEQERSSKMEELYRYMHSDEFQQKLNSLISSTENLRKLQANEKRAHATTWSKQDEEIGEIEQATSQIQSKVKAIIERVTPLPIITVGKPYRSHKVH